MKLGREPAEDLGVVGEGADDPVDEALEHGVQQSVAEVEQEGPRVPPPILEIDEPLPPIAVGVAELVGEAAGPDGGAEHGDGGDPAQAPPPPAGGSESEVEEVADGRGAEHLGAPVEDVVEALGAEREEAAIDVVELVGVEEVAGPCGGEDEQHPPVGEQLEDLPPLGGHGGVAHPGGAAAVVADDPGGRQEEEGKARAEEHERHEGDVGGVVDAGGVGGAVVVEGEGEEATEDAAEVEEAPEEGDVGAAAGRGWVWRHDGALRGPEESGPDAEEGAGGDGEGLAGGVVVVVEEGGGVERVGEGAGEEGDARAEEVVGGAAEDAEDGEAGVEGGVGVVGGGVVQLPAAAEPGQGVEHARAAEAHQPDQGHLHQRRVVPQLPRRRRRRLHLRRHGHSFLR